MIAKLDIAGEKYGRLTATNYDGYRGKKSWWRFDCDCGSSIVTTLDRVRSGQTKSCGCQNIASIKARSITHGHSAGGVTSKTLLAYRSAKGRCYNANNPKYPHYGDRGIKMCDRWFNDFQAFLDDMGECPKGMTLDRTDVNGDYEPGNCEWATHMQQAKHRTDNTLVSHNGKTIILKDFARLMDVDYHRVHYLVKRKTMTAHDAARDVAERGHRYVSRR